MASNMGRNATVRVGTNVVAEQVEWSGGPVTEVVDEPVFGDDHGRVHGVTVTRYSWSMSGLIDLTDTSGQNALESACIDQTSVNTIRFYINASDYWTPDTANDIDATAWITEYSMTAARGDVVRATWTVTGSGKWWRTA